MMKMFELKDKVAVVFGGTSGIGKAIATGMAKAGADVVAISRDDSKIAEMAGELRKYGKKALQIKADVIKKAEIEYSLSKVLETYGKVDILVNSAGAHHKKSTLDVSEAEWDIVNDINLKGTFLTCQVYGRQMIEQKDGRIINIASLGAHVALSEAAAYCASKAGVLLLTKCLAVEWAKHNVRVNSITPGVFRTALNEKALAIPERMEKIIRSTPYGRLGKAEELAGAAVFLASDASNFITGEDMAVDGGFLALGI